MKICIPTLDDRGLDSEAAPHFGRAPFFVFTDVEQDTDPKVVRNPACGTHGGDCHHVPVLQAHAVDAVVCQGIGRRAVAGLREAGIDVLVPPVRTVREIVEAVRAGRTNRLAESDACEAATIANGTVSGGGLRGAPVTVVGVVGSGTRPARQGVASDRRATARSRP